MNDGTYELICQKVRDKVGKLHPDRDLTACVRGNHTIGTNDTKHGHSYSVCITNSNGEPNVIKATRYRQSSLNYFRSPLNVSPDMESKEKDLSCDNQWTRNRNNNL